MRLWKNSTNRMIGIVITTAAAEIVHQVDTAVARHHELDRVDPEDRDAAELGMRPLI